MFKALVYSAAGQGLRAFHVPVAPQVDEMVMASDAYGTRMIAQPEYYTFPDGSHLKTESQSTGMFSAFSLGASAMLGFAAASYALPLYQRRALAAVSAEESEINVDANDFVAQPEVEMVAAQDAETGIVADLAGPITTLAVQAAGETPADLQALAKALNPVVGFYDPLNLAEAEFWETDNSATIGFLRHAEIKHGRVAMAGFVGFCVHANGIHFPWKVPGDELCAPGVSPPLLWEGIPDEAKWQILGTIGLFEFYSEAAVAKSPDMGGHYMSGGKPGFFPPLSIKGQVLKDADGNMLLPHPVPLNLYDPFGFSKKKSEEAKAKGLKIEINNGRLAMIGLMGFLSEGAIPGSVPLLAGKIPLSGEINVMSPLDFTKPLFG
jgi:hypothetical protein